MTKPEQEVLDAPAKVAEYSAVDAGLAELRTKVASTVYDITTTAGDKTARALRAECVSLRTSIEAKRVEAKKPLLEKGKLLDAEAKRITAEIVAIEAPIDADIRAEEKRKADEKAARERAEAEARRKIDQAIADLSYYPVHASGKTADEIENLCVELFARELTEEEFGARIGQAGLAKAAALEKLRGMHAAAVAQETEAARLAAERADLERQRQELADQRAQQRQDAIGETLDAGTKATLAPLPDEPAGWPALADEDTPFPVTPAMEDAVAHLESERSAAERIDMTGPEIASMAMGFAIRDTARELLDGAEAADNTAPGAAELIEVIADFYDVPPFTAEAWLRAAFGAKQ
ncbi:hypothetical protein [Bradyrhizobium elkanii]|uniref:hypothetical protein n=1 Tax=Bradyrhizobium elkanii TaxID=29448 RepID=UPI003516A9A7